MTIKSLDRVINPTFFVKLSRVTDANAGLVRGNAVPTGQALYNSLRTGARNFAAGMQMLSAGASFVNVSLDSNERMLEIVSKLEEIATKANRGNLSATNARRFRQEIDTLTGDFEKVIDAASDGPDDFLDVSQLEDVLVRGGLDSKKVRELALSLKRFSHPGEASLESDGTVSTDGNPIPLSDFQRMLRAAIFDDDEPGDDKAGFFARIKGDLKDIRVKLEGNIEALKATRELVGANLNLARSAGLAFLEVSDEMSGFESPEQIAEEIRLKIRRGAAGALAQVNNLEPIMVAGYLAVSSQEEE
jgi:hypothetical protein